MMDENNVPKVSVIVPVYQAEKLVTDMADKMSEDEKKDIETAKEAERGIIDIETLQQTNQTLISTLDEVMKIQTQGAEKRKEAEAELGRIEGELKQKLLELR